VSALKGFPRENKNLHVMESGLNPRPLDLEREHGRYPWTSEEEPFGGKERREHPKRWDRSNPGHPLR
jgi:hypothetical protein